MIELDEFLHTVDLLIHLGLDELSLLFLPLPQGYFLLSGCGCLAEGYDQCAVCVDIQCKYTFWMRVEDGLAWCTRIDVPYDQHRVLAGVGSDDDIAIFVIGGGGNLVALGSWGGTWPWSCLCRLFS